MLASCSIPDCHNVVIVPDDADVKSDYYCEDCFFKESKKLEAKKC